MGRLRDGVESLVQHHQASKVPRLQYPEDVAAAARLRERSWVEEAVRELPDKTLLMPDSNSWERWSVQMMCDRFGKSSGPAVPSPQRYFRATGECDTWLNLLRGTGKAACYRRGKGALRVWQNLALKIKEGKTQAEAVQELQSAYEGAKLEKLEKKSPYQMEKWWQRGGDAYGLKPLGCCTVFWDVLE